MQNQVKNLKGIFYIVIGMLVFSFQDIFIKILSSTNNLFLIYSFRSVIGVVVILCFLKFSKNKINLRTYYPYLTMLRCLLFFIGFTLFYISLSVLSYPIAITLFFTSPFFVTIFSKIILKEKIGIKRLFAIIIGFIGVVLVMDPKLNNFNFYTLFPIITALCYSLTVIIQNKTSIKDNLFAQTFHILFATSFLSLIIGSIIFQGQFDIYENEVLHFLFRKWELSMNLSLIFLLLIGICGTSGLLCLFQAYRIASPPTIAPFEYIAILFAIIFGWLIWGELINLQSTIGLFFIIAGGLYTFFREVKRNKLISVEKPLR